MYKVKARLGLRAAEILVIILSTGSCAVIGAGVEAKFVLAPDSRLPVWLSIPANVQRNDVVVILKYLTASQQSDDAVIEIQNRDGRVLGSVRGQTCWHPIMQSKKNKFGGFDSDVYPRYRYVKINGIAEVIEHRRMEPVFRVSDDADLRRIASGANSCDKG
jgi:hypothetical protein